MDSDLSAMDLRAIRARQYLAWVQMNVQIDVRRWIPS